MSPRLAALRLVHPFPSALNALLVLGLALLAGAAPEVALTLALAMLLLQFSIGAANDYFDVEADARTKPAKPIPRGLVSRRTALGVAVGSGGLALALAGAAGLTVLLLAAVMLAAGWAYDAALKPTAWGWACFAVAFPLLPVYAWWGAAGELPPRAELLLPLAALAGPALQLANGLVDLERDRLAGLSTLPVRLGRAGSLLAMGLLLGVIHGLAWLTLVGGEGGGLPSVLLVGPAGLLAGLGLALSSSLAPPRREMGWQAQALAIAGLAVGWLAAVLRAGAGG